MGRGEHTGWIVALVASLTLIVMSLWASDRDFNLQMCEARLETAVTVNERLLEERVIEMDSLRARVRGPFKRGDQ